MICILFMYVFVDTAEGERSKQREEQRARSSHLTTGGTAGREGPTQRTNQEPQQCQGQPGTGTINRPCCRPMGPDIGQLVIDMDPCINGNIQPCYRYGSQ